MPTAPRRFEAVPLALPARPFYFSILTFECNSCTVHLLLRTCRLQPGSSRRMRIHVTPHVHHTLLVGAPIATGSSHRLRKHSYTLRLRPVPPIGCTYTPHSYSQIATGSSHRLRNAHTPRTLALRLRPALPAGCATHVRPTHATPYRVTPRRPSRRPQRHRQPQEAD